MKNNITAVSIALIMILGGIYLSFIKDDTRDYDKVAQTYKIDSGYYSEHIDDEGYYSPIYHFEVNGEKYACNSHTSTNTPPKDEGKVYYKSFNPVDCKTDYDLNNLKVIGYILLGIGAYFLIAMIVSFIKKED